MAEYQHFINYDKKAYPGNIIHVIISTTHLRMYFFPHKSDMAYVLNLEMVTITCRTEISYTKQPFFHF